MSYWDRVDFEQEITRPISLTLNGNELEFCEGKGWYLVKSEVEKAEEEIERLRGEIKKMEDKNALLKDEITEINQTKDVMLEIVSEVLDALNQLRCTTSGSWCWKPSTI